MLAAVARYGTSLLADEHERSAFNWITNSTGNLTVWCSEPDDNVPLHGLDAPCPERLDAFKSLTLVSSTLNLCESYRRRKVFSG